MVLLQEDFSPDADAASGQEIPAQSAL